MMPRLPSRWRAFTFIELIVVIVVIAVLAAISAGVYNRYSSTARSNATLAAAIDLRTVVMATAARDDRTSADEAQLLWAAAGGDGSMFLTGLSTHYAGPVSFTPATGSDPATVRVGPVSGGAHTACVVLTEPPAVHPGDCVDGGAPPVGVGYAAAIASDDPVAVATLSDPAGSTSVATLGGQVTYTGGPSLGTDPGPVSGLTAMTGTGTAYSTIPAPFTAVTGAVELWLRVSPGVDPARNLWLLGGNNDYVGLWLMGTSGNADGPANSLCWQLNSTGGPVPNTPAAGLRDGAWHQIVLTRTSSSMQEVYVDGVLRSSQSNGSGSASSQLTVGITGYPLGRSDRPAIPAGVSMAEVAVFAAPLSATRVAAHYAAATS